MSYILFITYRCHLLLERGCLKQRKGVFFCCYGKSVSLNCSTKSGVFSILGMSLNTHSVTFLVYWSLLTTHDIHLLTFRFYFQLQTETDYKIIITNILRESFSWHNIRYKYKDIFHNNPCNYPTKVPSRQIRFCKFIFLPSVEYTIHIPIKTLSINLQIPLMSIQIVQVVKYIDNTNFEEESCKI